MNKVNLFLSGYKLKQEVVIVGLHHIFIPPLNPVTEIERLNQFMGTQRSGCMVQKIADSINFDRMKAFMLASQKVFYCAEKLPSNCDHNIS